MNNRDKPSTPKGAHNGLTKREYAAIVAMQGLLVNCGRSGTNLEDVRYEAIKQADTLFNELEKE